MLICEIRGKTNKLISFGAFIKLKLMILKSKIKILKLSENKNRQIITPSCCF
ncbi:hypothetical protein BC749_102538 [Flavobacterium araucananum]|nr:hypothetical protein BC749_102538 [Flavobacterium araucananum]